MDNTTEAQEVFASCYAAYIADTTGQVQYPAKQGERLTPDVRCTIAFAVKQGYYALKFKDISGCEDRWEVNTSDEVAR